MAHDQRDSWLELARQGDADAFGHLIEPLLPVAFRLAVGMLMNRDDAMDAVQEATVRAWRKVGNVTPGLPFSPWYLGIVTRECRHAAGLRWRVITRAEPREAAGADMPDSAQGEDIKRAMRTLSPAQRQVVLLHFYGDLTLVQVAATIGRPLGTVKSRLNRALTQLKPKLAERVFAGSERDA